MGRKTPEERFWEKVAVCEHGDCLSCCWEWQAYVCEWGYGTLWWWGTMSKAHRVSFFLKHGVIPEEGLILHHCDNPPCVNPDHLSVGTSLRNAQDMVARGRSNRGEHRPNARLTEAEVCEMRALYAEGVPQPALARRYGVLESVVGNAVIGTTWAYLPGAVERRGIASGERHGHRKLTWEAVRRIREIYHTGKRMQCELAVDDGVAPATIKQRVHNTTWVEAGADLVLPRRAFATGERHGLAQLTWSLVRAMRKQHEEEGMSIPALSAYYGINKKTVWSIVRYKRWQEETSYETTHAETADGTDHAACTDPVPDDR